MYVDATGHEAMDYDAFLETTFHNQEGREHIPLGSVSPDRNT